MLMFVSEHALACDPFQFFSLSALELRRSRISRHEDGAATATYGWGLTDPKYGNRVLLVINRSRSLELSGTAWNRKRGGTEFGFVYCFYYTTTAVANLAVACKYPVLSKAIPYTTPPAHKFFFGRVKHVDGFASLCCCRPVTRQSLLLLSGGLPTSSVLCSLPIGSTRVQHRPTSFVGQVVLSFLFDYFLPARCWRTIGIAGFGLKQAREMLSTWLVG